VPKKRPSKPSSKLQLKKLPPKKPRPQSVPVRLKKPRPKSAPKPMSNAPKPLPKLLPWLSNLPKNA